MQEITFLTEADLPYFRNLEKEGKAVIITISEEDLLKLDIDSLKQTKSFSLPEVLQWMEEHQIDFKTSAAKSAEVIQENNELEKELNKTFLDKLLEENVAPDKAEMFIQALQAGVSEEQLMIMFRKDISLEAFQKVMNYME